MIIVNTHCGRIGLFKNTDNKNSSILAMDREESDAIRDFICFFDDGRYPELVREDYTPWPSS